MLDINKFIMLLKCSWIKRLIVKYSSWTSILKAINGEDFVSLLLDFGDAFITECVIPKNNNFWKDMSMIEESSKCSEDISKCFQSVSLKVSEE